MSALFFMHYRRLLASLILLSLSACSSYNRAPVLNSQKNNPVAAYSGSAVASYTVKRGDTLYRIARRHDVSIAQLAAWNNLRPPYPLYPGQRLIVAAQGSPVAQPRKSAPRTEPMRRVHRGALRNNNPSYVRRSSGASCSGEYTEWQWPTPGRAERSFTANGRQGVNILGRNGAPVYAAAAGHISYSGPGLNGYYGNLIIIKHGQSFHSVYAYNRELYVHEGKYVNAGEHIADMGADKDQRALLHFEIRCHDKTVNPLEYLPR